MTSAGCETKAVAGHPLYYVGIVGQRADALVPRLHVDQPGIATPVQVQTGGVNVGRERGRRQEY
jgi:hypothetical protein